jgi:hypothetical protein
MIGDLLRFAVVHLGASVIAGLLVAGAVLAIARLLDIRDARVRSWLLGAAVVKATLVFLGLASLLHLPAAALDLGALPPSLIAPLVLAWAGTLLVLQGSIVRGFHHGDPADGIVASTDALGRLQASVARVTRAARGLERIDTSCLTCTVPADLATPAVQLTTGAGPATVDPAGDPVISIPADLLAELDDDELDAVVAHELGHVLVARDRQGCVPGWATVARWTSPGAALLGRLLDREVELACDQLAVRMTGGRQPLASALLKAIRRRRSTAPALAPVTNLVGRPRLLRDRVGRLVEAEGVPSRAAGPRVAAACALTLLVSAAL